MWWFDDKLLFLDILCPGGDNPCNGSGQCDLTIGECICDAGRHGSDCSSKIIL